MNLYLISGLATDARIFKYISVHESFNLFFLDLTTPKQNETLEDYAIRLSEKIDHSKPFILIGFSFGGILAIEISKQLKTVAIILISSITSSDQLPKYYRVGALHKLVPISMLKAITKMKRNIIYRKSVDKNILVQLADEIDPYLLRWSIRAILTWQNQETPWNTWQIHGSKDEILPARLTNPTHLIPNAKHLLLVNRAEEINIILRDILFRYEPLSTQRFSAPALHS